VRRVGVLGSVPRSLPVRPQVVRQARSENRGYDISTKHLFVPTRLTRTGPSWQQGLAYHQQKHFRANENHKNRAFHGPSWQQGLAYQHRKPSRCNDNHTNSAFQFHILNQSVVKDHLTEFAAHAQHHAREQNGLDRF